MQASELPRAVAAARRSAEAFGLTVDDAVVLHDSNRIALRLLPCDILARVAFESHQAMAFEVELAQRLAQTKSPVALLEPCVAPRIYRHDGFVVTLWVYYDPVPPHEIAPAEYALALKQLHAGMRDVDLPTAHFTDRVEEAQQLVERRDRSPELPDADRELLSDTLRGLRQRIVDRGAPEQLLHGEPHPGNLLRTQDGLLFVDLETCCRGPVEFDIAHAPEAIGAHYPGVDEELLRDCRMLMLAMIVAWRWDPADELPDGRRRGAEWLDQLRSARQKGLWGATGRCG